MLFHFSFFFSLFKKIIQLPSVSSCDGGELSSGVADDSMRSVYTFSKYIYQPALSQVVKKVEKELGYPIFERSGKLVKFIGDINKATKPVI